MISIILPTISGREASLARALAAYREHTTNPYEFVIVHDQPSWSTACNVGYARAAGEILHFSADDLEPLPGWDIEAVEWLGNHDELPAPVCLNFSADGKWDNEMDGPDKAVTHFTRIPIMRQDQHQRIGLWPRENYVADIWVSEKAKSLGILTRMIHSYRFIHHWEQTGRDDGPEVQAKAQRTLRKLRAQLPFRGLPHGEQSTGKPRSVPFHGIDP